jgi:peptidoglycan hydrolase-like protein with peptidoglycan-binding domain
MKSVSTCLVALLGTASVVMVASPSRAGDYSPEAFVEVLHGLGYPVALGDSINADRVRQSILDLQIQAMLPATGQLNDATERYAADGVGLIQRQLNDILGSGLPGSPFYRELTTGAIVKFQQRYGLPVTGIADIATRQELQRAVLDLSRTAPPPGRASRGVETSRISTYRVPAANLPGNLYTESEFRVILQGLGYDISPDRPLSDRPTVRAIRNFQRQYRLSETGVADGNTENTARQILRSLQQNLQAVVDRDLPVTDFYDAPTRALVQRFQRIRGITVDGIATPNVRKLLQSLAQRR